MSARIQGDLAHGGVGLAQGARCNSRVPIFRQSIDPCVTTRPGTGQTARIRRGGVWDHWMEAGYREKSYCEGCPPSRPPRDFCDFVSGHCFDFFAEWGLFGGSQARDRANVNGEQPPCTRPNLYVRFQAYKILNTYKWRALYDCQTGQGWKDIISGSHFYNTGYLAGVPEGEGFHRNQTTMTGQTHGLLLYMRWNGQRYEYLTPTRVVCDDDSPSWDGVAVGPRQFNFVPGSSFCSATDPEPPPDPNPPPQTIEPETEPDPLPPDSDPPVPE